MRTLVIVNPRAGGGRKPAVAERCLRRLGLAEELGAASSLEDIRELARRGAEDYERVIICGGDGSVNAAAQGLAGSGCALAIVPCGVGNDIARSLGLPVRVREACRLLPRLSPVAIDLIRVGEGGLYVGVGTVGAAARIAAWTRYRKGFLPWWGLYPAAFAGTIASAPAPRVEVCSDIFRFQGEAALAAFANGALLGRYFRVAPKASMSDGLLDVCIVAAAGRGRLLSMLASVPLGRHLGRPGVVTGRARRLAITSERPLEFWADGECFGTTPLMLEVVPKALKVLAGRSA